MEAETKMKTKMKPKTKTKRRRRKKTLALSISNVDISLFPHKPSNTSFVDVTLVGDSVSLSGWHYPVRPSLSYNPFISYDVVNVREMVSPASSVHRLPSPKFCNIPLFVSCLDSSLANIIRPDDTHAINSTNDIDDVLSSLNLVLKSVAFKNKLAFHGSLAPAKMPLWYANLWALRSNLRDSYKLKRESPFQQNIDAYIKKALYQRGLRSSKKESWKSFCNDNLNKDIFGEIKKIVSFSPPDSILLLSHKIAYDSATAFSDEPLSSTPTKPYVTKPDFKQAFDCLLLTKSPGPDGIYLLSG
ncbi:hypothetical protein DAPPUDRAFT_113108 [Daphnia pulex]|uniref:Uncharacterized protein n=1 Tax=Daphnia pulex TaxID=6669 RepID=E9HE34_DAPPU|nr:hypothetical protein DAPPUDRAFT_113108 [Daphnia pulex]|eukprot:EFX70000.1 hypothetical protein DAPPUDRAFT_113108 [Daphnia pulex]